MIVHAERGEALVTLLNVRGASATLLICSTNEQERHRMAVPHVTLARDEMTSLGKLADLIVVDILGDKVRLGFDLHHRCDVHRLEVWEAVQNTRRRDDDADDGGSAGKLAPRPTGPKPPMLDVRLPPPTDESN